MDAGLVRLFARIGKEKLGLPGLVKKVKFARIGKKVSQDWYSSVNFDRISNIICQDW